MATRSVTETMRRAYGMKIDMGYRPRKRDKTGRLTASIPYAAPVTLATSEAKKIGSAKSNERGFRLVVVSWIASFQSPFGQNKLLVAGAEPFRYDARPSNICFRSETTAACGFHR